MEFTFKPININFQFNKSDFVNIVFENKNWFCNFIKSIASSKSDIDNDFIFDDDTRKVFNNIELVFSPFDLNSKSLSNALLKYLSSKDYCFDYDYIKSKLVAFGDSVILESDLNIDYDDEQINLQKILKLYNFKICDVDNDHKEKLINYLDAYHKVFPDISFCFINVCSYFNPRDLDLIFEWCKLNNVFVFNIASELSVGYNFDKIILIDKDLCVLN